jgi:hypothetical protein
MKNNIFRYETTLELEPRQLKPISTSDKRLLLGATLRLLGHKFVLGKRISREELLHAASLADEDV